MLWYASRWLMLIALLISSLSGVGTVKAQSPDPTETTAFTVDSNSDLGDLTPGDGVCRASNNKCTLRAAIDEHNALSGGGVISLPAMTFVLTQNRDLTISDGLGDDSLSITGAGQSATIIDGNNATRIFDFMPYTGSHALANITLRNADNKSTGVKDRNGGGVFNEATLSMTNVTVANNKAYQGGGVYNEYAFNGNVPSLTLVNVTLTGNTAKSTELGMGGGGLFNGSRLTGDGVIISGNNAAIQGGGFYNNSHQSQMVLRNFNISYNTAKMAAGINNDLTTYPLVLENGIISYNVSNCCHPGNNFPTGGAGIYNNEAHIRLTNVWITNNSVPDTVKGGGYGAGLANMMTAELVNVSFTYNQSTYGAAIYNGNYNGWANQLTMTNVTISNNHGPAGMPDSEAAALYAISGDVTILNSTITQNSAEYTGGIKNFENRSTINLKNTILSGNSDTLAGAFDCRGRLYSHGYNMIGDYQGSSQFPCTITPAENPARPDKLGLQPSLQALTGNPAYHPLNFGCQAIDGGTNDQCPAFDIAGQPRPAGQKCDIGAFEFTGAVATGDHKIFLPAVVK